MIIDFEIKRPITLDELWKQADYLNALELSSENDRAYILVSAVAIEDQIYKILKALLPQINCLDDNQGFTFSFKINLLKSYELYNPKIVEYAHLVRKIRNEFAHNLTYSSFEYLPSGTQSNIDQRINEINPQHQFTEVRQKIDAIVKWLFWELNSLLPYAQEINKILNSTETKKPSSNL